MHSGFTWPVGISNDFQRPLAIPFHPLSTGKCVQTVKESNATHHVLFYWHTVYPKKYAHGFVVLCFVVVMQSFIMNSYEVFIHIHQGCFAGTGAIVRLPHCQWSKPDGHGKISQCITTTKHNKAKTVCIFLEKYCTTCHRKNVETRDRYDHWNNAHPASTKDIWLWRHQMEAFSMLLSLCAGNPPVTGGFPSQRDSNADLWCYFVVSWRKLFYKPSIDR